jgi:hypothetical protein
MRWDLHLKIGKFNSQYNHPKVESVHIHLKKLREGFSKFSFLLPDKNCQKTSIKWNFHNLNDTSEKST